MNQEFEDELSPEERLAFDSLPREKVPPSSLEERVVQSLKQSGLISTSQKPRRLNASHVAMGVAAALLFFILGATVTKWFSGRSQPAISPDFMLVLRQNREQSLHRPAEETLRLVKEYGNWARQLGHQGVLADGEKLKDEVRVLSVVDGRTVASNNPADLRQANIAGYFLIKAQNYEQAIRVAESCPHLKYGGTIEVREIDRSRSRSYQR